MGSSPPLFFPNLVAHGGRDVPVVFGRIKSEVVSKRSGMGGLMNKFTKMIRFDERCKYLIKIHV